MLFMFCSTIYLLIICINLQNSVSMLQNNYITEETEPVISNNAILYNDGLIEETVHSQIKNSSEIQSMRFNSDINALRQQISMVKEELLVKTNNYYLNCLTNDSIIHNYFNDAISQLTNTVNKHYNESKIVNIQSQKSIKSDMISLFNKNLTSLHSNLKSKINFNHMNSILNYSYFNVKIKELLKNTQKLTVNDTFLQEDINKNHYFLSEIERNVNKNITLLLERINIALTGEQMFWENCPNNWQENGGAYPVKVCKYIN